MAPRRKIKEPVVTKPVWEFKEKPVGGTLGWYEYEWILVDPEKVIKEDWVKEQIKRILEYYITFYFMPQNVGMGVSGIPDFIGCHHGKFFGIEAKRKNGGVVSAMQWIQLNKINTAQGFAVVVDEYGLKDLFELFKKLHLTEPNRVYYYSTDEEITDGSNQQLRT